MTDWNDRYALIDGTHFRVGEVIASSGYAKMPRGPMLVGPLLGITPRRNATKHAHAMEALRRMVNVARARHDLPATGVNLISWARSWKHNREIGGARLSQHLWFRACDISRQEIERLCPWHGGGAEFDAMLNTVFKSGGVGLYPAGGRHADSRGVRARWTSF